MGEAVHDVVEWARLGESRYVCVANVYNVMLARREHTLDRTLPTRVVVHDERRNA